MASISSSMAKRWAQPASDTSGRAQSPGSLTTAVTNVSAPISCSSVAICSADASASALRAGSWQASGTKAPETRSPWASSTGLSSSGSVGSQPMAPSSVVVRPRSRISDRTRSTGSCAPQPGTSQMPHEIGAPATLAMIPASVIPPT